MPTLHLWLLTYLFSHLPIVARIVGTVATVPLFAAQQVPGIARIALSIALGVLVAGLVIRSSLPDIIAATNSSIPAMVMTTVHVAGQMVLKCLVVMLIIGAADYGYQFYEHEKRLRMTRHELREELRELEGDPLIQAQRRRRRVV